MAEEFLRSHKSKSVGSPYWDWVGMNGGREPSANSPLLAASEIPEDDQLDAILAVINSGALEQLTPMQQRVWQLCGVEGMTHEQASDFLKIDRSVVTKHFQAACSTIEEMAEVEYKRAHDCTSQNRNKLKELADLAKRMGILPKKTDPNSEGI